jgi:galactose-1-phosphate uridylyltransferase family 2
MVDSAIRALVRHGEMCGLLAKEDETYAENRLLEVLGLDAIPEGAASGGSLAEILQELTDDAVSRGLVQDDIVSRDLFDTKLMGALTPWPREVCSRFRALYDMSPREATDWFYRFCQDVNYIRRDRIAKDLKWLYPCQYGDLDITINLSKPEKDPKAIAAARLAPQAGYPKCQLCRENEGYAGRMNHPARQNLRMIPLRLAGENWYFQYSPYVYYNEHCIVLNENHTPMKISRATFERLLDFVSQFPHYFLGSNADLPIVGGSILSHDHFQGGHYEFAMAKAPVETPVQFADFPDISAGIVAWPMSVVRLTGKEPGQLVELADRILGAWRAYSDETVGILAESDGAPHNTVTPIARRRGEAFELDLVLRNNRATDEFPLGIFHPHQELHHIKKENIGLIEVMGLAVLPSRLSRELAGVREAILQGKDLRADETLQKHADWVDELKRKYEFTAENADELLRREVGSVFLRVLLDAGVYKRTPEGQAAFLRFLNSCGAKQ